MNRIAKIIASIGSGASIISLGAFCGLVFWAKLGIIVFGVLCTVFLIFAALKANSANEYECKDEEEIKERMIKIIKTQGKICIMSRDLSWVDDEVAACIEKKSASVLIFAKSKTEMTMRLARKGVDVRYYGDTRFEPQTRFTIIRYNGTNPQIAIANPSTANFRRRNGAIHKIYMTGIERNSKFDSWIGSLARDLTALCELTSKPAEKE